MKITTQEDIINAVKSNHIWLNAIHCKNPTPEFCENLGRQILSLLDSQLVLPKYNEDISSESESTQKLLNEFAVLTPTLYLSLNKS